MGTLTGTSDGACTTAPPPRRSPTYSTRAGALYASAHGDVSRVDSSTPRAEPAAPGVPMNVVTRLVVTFTRRTTWLPRLRGERGKVCGAEMVGDDGIE